LHVLQERASGHPHWGLIDFHALGEGPRSHEILHHATVPELVLDGVRVVRASLLLELLKVIRGWPHLTLANTCSGHSAHHAGAACLLVVAAVIAGRECGLLTSLLAPLLAALGTLLGILDDDIG
jgi:hypothetical protein